MKNNNQNDQVHGLEFFERHFRQEKTFIDFIKLSGIFPDQEAIKYLDLMYDPEAKIFYEKEICHETGEFDIHVFMDIKKELKERLNNELGVFEYELKKRLRTIQSDNEGKIYFESVFTSLVQLHHETKSWKAFNFYGLNQKVFLLFAIKQKKTYGKYIIDEKLKRELTELEFEITPEYHLSRFMDEKRWAKLKEWLSKNKPDEKIELARFLRNDLVKTGYLKKKIVDRIIQKIFVDTWGLDVSLNTIKSAKEESNLYLPPVFEV